MSVIAVKFENKCWIPFLWILNCNHLLFLLDISQSDSRLFNFFCPAAMYLTGNLFTGLTECTRTCSITKVHSHQWLRKNVGEKGRHVTTFCLSLSLLSKKRPKFATKLRTLVTPVRRKWWELATITASTARLSDCATRLCVRKYENGTQKMHENNVNCCVCTWAVIMKGAVCVSKVTTRGGGAGDKNTLSFCVRVYIYLNNWWRPAV